MTLNSNQGTNKKPEGTKRQKSFSKEQLESADFRKPVLNKVMTTQE